MYPSCIHSLEDTYRGRIGTNKEILLSHCMYLEVIPSNLETGDNECG